MTRSLFLSFVLFASLRQSVLTEAFTANPRRCLDPPSLLSISFPNGSPIQRQALSSRGFSGAERRSGRRKLSSRSFPIKETRSSWLFQASSNDGEGSSYVSFNAIPAVAWVFLMLFGFVFAPGSLDGAANDILQDVIANPTNPGLNELFYAVFNLVGIMPLVMAALVVPQAGKDNGLPATPFVALSSALGFFAFGPYMALRKPPVRTTELSSRGWFTKNVLENKLYAVVVTALIVLSFLPAVSAYQLDPQGQWNGFVATLLSDRTARFASVSTADLVILTITAVSLTPRDYSLRKPTAGSGEALAVAAATALLPLLGSAMYLIFRPPLPDKMED